MFCVSQERVFKVVGVIIQNGRRQRYFFGVETYSVIALLQFPAPYWNGNRANTIVRLGLTRVESFLVNLAWFLRFLLNL